MQFEVDEVRRARLLEVTEDRTTHHRRTRADRARIPHLREQRLEVVREPRQIGVRVDRRHEHVPRRDDGTFRHRTNLDRKTTAVHAEDALPAGTIEGLRIAQVSCDELLGLINLLSGDDLALQVGLEPVLQTEEHGSREFPATTLEEREGVARTRRILLPVRELVRVREGDDVAEELRVHDTCPWLEVRWRW